MEVSRKKACLEVIEQAMDFLRTELKKVNKLNAEAFKLYEKAQGSDSSQKKFHQAQRAWDKIFAEREKLEDTLTLLRDASSIIKNLRLKEKDGQ